MNSNVAKLVEEIKREMVYQKELSDDYMGMLIIPMPEEKYKEVSRKWRHAVDLQFRLHSVIDRLTRPSY